MLVVKSLIEFSRSSEPVLIFIWDSDVSVTCCLWQATDERDIVVHLAQRKGHSRWKIALV